MVFVTDSRKCKSQQGNEEMTVQEKPSKKQKMEKAVQFKVSLSFIRPPIWRRVLLPDNATLGDLHQVIQIAMGWSNSHMHAFRIGGMHYTNQAASEMDDMGMENEECVLLADIVTQTEQKFIYEYDFGDSWEHEIVVEKFLSPDAETNYPVCLAGKRACPPEDCGSFPGYMSIVEALTANKPTEGQKELLEWVDEDYDPECFDLDDVNRRLKTVALT
jgi:hypothetical protein